MKRIISIFILCAFLLDFYFINEVTQDEQRIKDISNKITTLTGQQLCIADTIKIK